jgi:hypothetical protein
VMAHVEQFKCKRRCILGLVCYQGEVVTPLNITSVSASLRNYLRNWLDDGGEE